MQNTQNKYSANSHGT